MASNCSVLGRLKTAFCRMDRVLLLALMLAVAMDLNGIRWGRVEDWNPDQMALRGLRAWGKPSTYVKPPLHTYINSVLVEAPLGVAEQIATFVKGERQYYTEAKVLLSRLLVLALFCGTIVLAYKTCLFYFNVFTARFAALGLATSAGFVAYNHFLTCDSPLLFFLIASGYFAARIYFYGKRSDYLLTGLLVAASANTKYNGLAVGIMLVAAHLARPGLTWRERMFSSNLIWCLVAVPVGLFLTNPFMVLDWKNFSADFAYNYTVAPKYSGEIAGHGYLKFLTAFPEVFGWPGTVLLAVSVFGSLVAMTARRVSREAVVGFAVTVSFVLVYYAKIGGFPRLPVRFVLPVMPAALLLAGPLFCASRKIRWGVAVLGVPVLAYNVVCGVIVGNRFAADPRLEAQDWMLANVKPGFVIESSGRCPHWCKLRSLNGKEVYAANPKWEKAKGADVIDLRIPKVSERRELFMGMFKDNDWMREEIRKREKSNGTEFFSPETLRQRNPNVMAVIEGDLEETEGVAAEFYTALLKGEYGYKTVLDVAPPNPPKWAYPQGIDFLDARMVLLVRK